jgi:two-component system, OmpR family, response regulator MprA
MPGEAHARTVLIVDDQRVVLRVFAQALERAGYTVQLATDADAALHSVRTAPPDAILLDLTMPYVNGMGLLYRLRDTGSKIPVAMITGNAVSSETRDELEALGVAVYFKPLTAPQIQQVVDKLVESTSGGAG